MRPLQGWPINVASVLVGFTCATLVVSISVSLLFALASVIRVKVSWLAGWSQVDLPIFFFIDPMMASDSRFSEP